MGGGQNQLNNINREFLGFLSPSAIQTVIANGDYLLTPIEYNGMGVSALRIPLSFNYYYIEFQQPAGVFDPERVRDLVSIRQGYGGSETFLVGAPAVGQIFTDSPNGISVATISVSPTGALMHIAFDPAACKLQPPSISITPAVQSGKAGSSLAYTVTVTNKSMVACPAQTYAVMPNLPSRWTQGPSSYSVTLGYGASDTRTVSITSPGNAKPGDYQPSEKINLSQKLYSKRSAVYSVIQ